MQITAENTSSNVYWIYDVTGNYVRNEEVINKLKDYTFQVIEAISFKNEYKSSYGSSEILLRYSGTYAYRKYPVVVPFDRKEGWYAGIKYPETAYDASGVIREFWLCNVGEDGIEEFQLEDFGGDYCQLINTAQANDANAFSNSVNIKQKINEAILAISRAQKGYKDGVTKVSINANVGTVKVGEPVTSTPVGQCTDYMSVEDCSLLFNVCDPVICPASRCDYGGKYPVTDVIQTGVVGSLFLCYPNAKWEGGDVYVPFCISGINAGLENWITVKKDYAACLQKSIDTGETVGICDEMHSIYLCEFFWKQAIPVVKLMGPRILEKVVGQSSRGGGEYQSIVEAFKNAQNSVTSFTQYYAENSYRAFKARSTEEIGTSICGSFASVVYPDGGTFLSNLIAPDSPFQFTGKFEESQLTTSTNPPTSHYKVYFHIYAGTDSGAYYSVKLRGSGSSYYQDTIVDRMVDSGYIPRGESVDEAMDFTAPSGYSTLCINVNGREECGFKEVSTSFAVNYLSDLYVKDQATDKDITTKDDCTSGSASIYSLLDLNAESAADNLLNSELYSQGIIRTCSTNSPGAGTDPLIGKEGERWKKVGYCDDKNIGCWIDTKSVEDAMKFLNLEEEALSEIDKNALTSIGNSYFSFEEFNSKKQEVKAETDSIKKIALINSILNTGKIFYNNQKAYLYLEKGKAYASLAMEAYTSYLKVKEEEDKLLNAPCDESILGKRILTIAQNKIGTDTTRLQAGSWVKDNVCATFVSNVLIEAGALPALGNDPLASATSDRDAIVELIPIMVSGGYTEIPRSDWQTGLKEGDVIVWGCQGSGCSDKPDADKYQHITIFSRYYVTGSSVITEIIHDPGTPGPVAAKNYTAPFGTTWYITYVYRAACADITEIPEGTIEPDIDENEVDGGYVSPAIEFEDGSSETNVCYKFFNSEWHWAIAETGRGTAFNPSCNDPDFPKGRKWFDTSTFIDEKDRQLDDVSVNFVESLEGKDYLGGIELLIKRTTNIKKEGIFNKELSSYYRDSGSYSGTGTYDPERLTVQRDVVTTMNHKGIFEVDIRNARISPIYYQFKGVNGWKWGVNDDTLLDVSTTVIPSGNYNGLTPTENVGLINSLNGNTNLYEGGAILLDPETAQLRSEYGSTSGANMDTSSLESNFQRRDLTKLTNLMKLLSTSVSSASFRCNCGTDCEDYAEWIVQYSGVSNIPDELLLLAIMSQESFCTSILSPDGNDVGLMQINLGNCGYYGLPTNKNTCKNNLLEDEELNIRVGAQHLRLKYSAYKDGLTFNCPPIIETYSGWEAALRGYNGWGCTGDDNYVENVKSKYFELLRLYGGNLPVAPAPSLSDSELATILVGFSSAEKKAITDAIICNDCGEGIANFCDPKECEAIGFKLFKECKYISLAFGLGKCEEVICTQGETKCVEDLYYTCVEEGTSWIAEHVKGKCGYT